MKRIRRFILGSLTLLSLLLLLAAAALWVRSYWWMDGGTFYTRHSFGAVWIDRGRVWLQVQPQVSDNGITFRFGEWLNEKIDPADGPSDLVWSPTYERGGFQYGHFFTSMAHDAWWVSIPWWWLVVVLSLLPARAMLRLIFVRRRVRANVCRKCGYDLRASPVRCPECGTPVSSPASLGKAKS